MHCELCTSDVGKAKGFYAKLFDWKLDDMPMPDGTYTIINVGEGTGGGMMKHPMPGAPSFWMPYVVVDDIEATTAKVKANGGTVMKDKTEVKDMGWFAIIVDPTGAMLDIWKTKSK